MDTKAIIESYVGDVVRHLSRRQRQDVGLELRSLLAEELAGRSAEEGRPADMAMTMQLLTAFGRPQEVADRYRPAGFTVIRAADAPRFAAVALGGVLLQWAVSLPAAFVGSAQVGAWASASGAWWGRLSHWWLTWGLGAFWWPGLLVTLTLAAAAFGRSSEAKPWVAPRAVDREQVSRPGVVVALGAWVVGASVVIALPWLAAWAPGLPQPLLEAFAVDPDFLARRAIWVLPMWAAHFGLYVGVLLAGRWSRDTRRAQTALNLGWLALITWWLAAGRIFAADATEGVVRLSLAAVLLIALVGVVAGVRRTLVPVRPSAV